jgi:hypothetical protein
MMQNNGHASSAIELTAVFIGQGGELDYEFLYHFNRFSSITAMTL